MRAPGMRKTTLPGGLAGALAMCWLAGAAEAQTACEERLAVYRSGEFAAARRASVAISIDRLRDEAGEYSHSFPGRARGFDLELPGAAMPHFDLAGAAGMEPEKSESIARALPQRVSDGRREGWSRSGWRRLEVSASAGRAAVRARRRCLRRGPRRAGAGGRGAR